MENATNAENIMPSLNIRDLLPVKKKIGEEISYLADKFRVFASTQRAFTSKINKEKHK